MNGADSVLRTWTSSTSVACAKKNASEELRNGGTGAVSKGYVCMCSEHVLADGCACEGEGAVHVSLVRDLYRLRYICRNS